MKVIPFVSLLYLFSTLILADQESNKTLSKIGIIGCMKPKKAPAFFNYISQKPDLMIWLGDNVYADAKTVVELEESYNQLYNRKGFKEVRKIETLATWDDHDYGLNNSGYSNPLKHESKRLFTEFWGTPEFVKNREGIYHAKIFGKENQRVQIIMLDCRFSKTKQQILSEEQWLWLSKELLKPAELRLIVSGQQVLVPKESKFETWTKVGNEQERLFETIKKSQAKGVVFITGDQHYAEVLKKDKALGYNAWEFMFGGVNQEEKSCPKASPLRVDEAHNPHKSAFLKINWTKNPSLIYEVLDHAGTSILKREVSISELETKF